MTSHLDIHDLTNASKRPRISCALIVALLSFVAWDVAFTLLRPEFVGDERHHVPAIEDAAHGDWTKVLRLPMPPTYHWLAVQATRAVGPELWSLRAFQTLWTLLAIVLYHAAARAYRPDYSGRDLLRFAWHPLIIAFGALVCTDIASLVAILLTLNFHIRRRYILGSLALAAAIMFRQSNIMWAAYFLTWALAEDWLKAGSAATTKQHTPRLNVSAAKIFREPAWPIVVARLRAGAWAYLAVFLLGGVAVTLAGRGVLLAQAMSNRAAFNPAVFYLLAIAVALLWLPAWLARFAEFWSQRYVPALMWIRVTATVVAAIGVVAMEFRNPHPWNMDLDFPHNWPLYAMNQFSSARAAIATVLVAFVITYFLDAARSPARRMLALTWIFTIAFLLPHNLADLRYYIIPLVLLDFLTPRGATEGRVLAAWHLVLSLAIAGVLALKLGGIEGML